MEKILTIIIPTYNMEKYLQKCLDSLIIDENMDKVEVLIINDGSKDKSSVIGHIYQDRFPNTFRVIDKENGNYGSCINRGLKEATGKYIKVLDADDSFEKTNYQIMINQLLTVDCDLFFTDYVTVDESDSITGNFKRKFIQNKQILIDEIIEDISTNLLEMYSVAYKTELLRSINYKQTEGISYTDQEWVFLPVTTIRTVYYSPIIVYRYLLGRAGQTMDPKVLGKSMPQKLKTVLSMLKEYGTLSGQSQSIDNYLNARLKWLILDLYKYYLIDSGYHYDLSLISELDRELLSSNPNLYSTLDKIQIRKGIPYTFIKHWRYSKHPYFLNIYRRLIEIKRNCL